MNGDGCRQCVAHLLGKQLLPSAILPCPTRVPAVKLTVHSVPVRRENEPCCPCGLVAGKLGKVHEAAQMEQTGPLSGRVLVLVVSENNALVPIVPAEKILSHVHPFVPPARGDISLFNPGRCWLAPSPVPPCGSKSLFLNVDWCSTTFFVAVFCLKCAAWSSGLRNSAASVSPCHPVASGVSVTRRISPDGKSQILLRCRLACKSYTQGHVIRFSIVLWRTWMFLFFL